MRNLVYAAGLAVVLLAGALGCNSPLEGRWKMVNRPGSLIVQPGGTVSIFGVDCRWTETDGEAIRISECLSEIRDDSGRPFFPFNAKVSFDFRLTEDSNNALLSVFMLELPFKRVP